MTDTSSPRFAAVTGAASGIGAATAKLLMSQGYRVACLDRNLEGARAVAGPDNLAVAIDVADEASVTRAFAEVGRAFGRIDALAACAGVIESTPFLETTPDQFRRLFDINVIGLFLSVREGAKLMGQGGRIVLTASISGYTGGGYVATGAYAASKGAVPPLMKSFAREYGPRGIGVNAIAPGFIDTPFVAKSMADPDKRKVIEATLGDKIGKPEQIAEAIAWMLSPAAAFMHGETMIVDGGLLMR